MIGQGGMRHVFWSGEEAGPEALESRGKVPAAARAAREARAAQLQPGKSLGLAGLAAERDCA